MRRNFNDQIGKSFMIQEPPSTPLFFKENRNMVYGFQEGLDADAAAARGTMYPSEKSTDRSNWCQRKKTL